MRNGLRQAAMAGGVLAIVIISMLRFIYAVDMPRTWDEVDFSLALSEFDLLAMQPHFPGYPYFILGGMIAHSVIEEPAKALAYFNVTAGLLASIPLYLIGRRFLASVQSIWMVVFIQALPFLSVNMSVPMSEGAAFSFLWWYIWAVLEAKKRGTWPFHLLASFFFSLLMGIRLSYLLFGIGLLLLWLHDWGKKRSAARTGILIGAAVLFQFIWVWALAATEGGLFPFLTLAFSFTEGHFQDWGGAISTEQQSYGQRLFTLLFYNLIWVGLCGKSWAVCFGYAVLLLLLLVKKPALRNLYKHELFLLAFAYLLWAFFAQNVEKPRHILPLPAFLIIFLFYSLKKAKILQIGYGMMAVMTGVQFATSVQWLDEQHSERHAVYQMADYLAERPPSFMIYTWEEIRVLQYLEVPYPHKRIQTFDYFLQEVRHSKYDTIFVTNHVLKGFEAQGADLDGQVEKVKTFTSNALFDPVYHEIVLYKVNLPSLKEVNAR